MAILTRQTTASGVTNNGAPLTNDELDNNFVELQQNKVNTSDLNEAVDDRVNNLLQAGLGIDLDYDDVAGQLTIDSNHVEVNCTNQTGASIPKGTVVYQTGVSGNNITIAPADADDAAKMPAIGLTTDTIADTAEGTITILGVVNGLDTSAFAAGDTLYVSTTAGALSTAKPTGETGLIQNFGRVLKVNASSGAIAVMGAGRSNAVPNLNDGNVFIGNGSNQAETRALAAGDIQSGTFADGRISESSVTQHEAALSITESQISDFGTYLPTSGGTMTGALTLNADPTANLQAATKQYVDTLAAASLHYHDPVRVEQEGNLTATYDNGTAGVGATLTNSGTQAALVIDGVTLSTSDRVLIYEQTNAFENGVYTVTDTGSASTNWVLTRATDADSYSPSDPDSLGQGDAFFVLEGTAGAGELYVMNTSGSITFGTTGISFAQVSSAQVYSGGTGISIAGSVISSDITLDEVTANGATTANNISVGAVTFTDLNDGTITITGFADEDAMTSDSASLLPTQQSVKAYVDNSISAFSTTLDGLTDTTVTTVSDNEVLAYDSATSKWINQTAAEASLATAAQGSLADSALQNVVEDTTPQLGGNLDFNGNIATSFASTGIDDNATSIAITIDSSQNVGIGETVPDKELVVRGSTQQISRFSTSSGTRGYITFADANTTTENNQGIGVVGNDVKIWAGNAEVVTVDDTGNVGIGATTVNALLHLKDNDPVIRFEDDEGGAARTYEAGSVGGNFVVKNINQATQPLTILDSGNVGIGVTNPTNGKLCVDGTINITDTAGTYAAGALGYTDSNWGFLNRPPRAGAIGAHAFQSFAGSTLMTVTDGGNVGINVSDPDAKLEISLADNDTSTYFHGGGFRGLKINDETISNDGDHTKFSKATSTGTYSFNNNNGELLRISSNGNVGIGTSSANHKLTLPQVDGTSIGMDASAGFTLNGTSCTYYGLTYQNGTGTGFNTILSGYDNILFATLGAERLRITSSGNVGIGTTSPSSVLTSAPRKGSDPTASSTITGLNLYNGQANVTGDGVQLLFDHSYGTPESQTRGAFIRTVTNNSYAGSVSLAIGTSSGDSLAERMRIDSSGNVGIGVTPSVKLDVATASGSTYVGIRRNSQSAGEVGLSLYGGTSGINWSIYQPTSSNDIRFYGNGADRLTLDSSGNLTATGNVTAYSDERLKSDIETLDGSKVYEMRGVSFTKDGEAGSGVIAQELQKVAPELVNDSGEYLSVAYGNLVGYLIEAVKELKAEIEELKNGSSD